MTKDTLEYGAELSPNTDTGGIEKTSDIRQFVTFIVGEEVFAVDMTPVQEIIRVPEVVKVPLAPATLDGLANLRGKVLPIISLRRIFGFADRAYDDASRAVVIDQGQPLGFVVDRVVSVVGVDLQHIEDTAAIKASINTELVSGLLKDVGGYPMIMVLDFAKLISKEFAGAMARSKSEHAATEAQHALAREAQTEEKTNDELHLVNFEVAGQEYAIVIDDVQEIVQVPELIIRVPHSKAHVLGVMTLRNRLLPLVSLRCMFNLPAKTVDENSRIVVVSLGAASVGLVMDSVNEVLRVARCDVDVMPALLAKDLADISQICRLDGGKRLVSILSVDHMFRHAVVKDALTSLDTMSMNDTPNSAKSDALTAERGIDDDEQFVVFLLGKEEFAVPIDSVQQIVRVAETLTKVPKAPPEVEGVVNLRGAVLPVMDLRRRLGLDQIERSDRQRIMVFLTAGVRTGFIVDSVVEVLKIHKSTIEAAPDFSGEQSLLLARMANLEKQKRMIQLIDPLHLIETSQLDDLAEIRMA
ncbi:MULTISPECIES: chemotaxis protein CheW [unclassified Undibacterium]|uniref:chemotaxis protein CheW n=1 Tax=unclassified Undibacterium TaxID=2630295 RepID=UPI002AC9B9C0|nr:MULTISPECIES: chemotaxis protein CheW [unclassified Undibacterium]MEB0140152.1 chemotaxis protein CheW [Undibacterium sp. CCC2.1]MEB0172474.1 chemotaxis protein CheW [Undibacterium sp. CCC1.1]MEB0176992.1 chemotaxis protein CheW [Undibacterium sp. CCC3.4]MEB0215596.1 chemotaxis protein CheW [Undibacterium sp. 5I2]WPX43697.1 chemotaxis protein CheW [Undibacterium sp. CCC3.4]